MNKIKHTNSAVSVLVDDNKLADDLYEQFLTIADNEGFRGDRRIFQEFIDCRKKLGEELIFNYGFAWNTFDRVEAGFLIKDFCENNIKIGYSIIIGVNVKDELTLDAGLLLCEKFEDEKLRYINVCGPSYTIHRSIFAEHFAEMLEVYACFLGNRQTSIVDDYKNASNKVLSIDEIDKWLMNSHLGATIRNKVRDNLQKLDGETKLIDISREFAKIGLELFENQGNRYFEVAGRLMQIAT